MIRVGLFLVKVGVVTVLATIIYAAATAEIIDPQQQRVAAARTGLIFETGIVLGLTIEVIGIVVGSLGGLREHA